MTRSKGKAALYLRSSKDRSDVSIDAQRRELVKLADERELAIVAEFTDVVESGKDENRPGFQELIAAVRSRSRDWSTLLLLDTSRLTRRRHLAVLFEHEAERRGVKVLYRTVPGDRCDHRHAAAVHSAGDRRVAQPDQPPQGARRHGGERAERIPRRRTGASGLPA